MVKCGLENLFIGVSAQAVFPLDCCHSKLLRHSQNSWSFFALFSLFIPRSLYFLTGSFKEVYFNCLPIYSEILILQCNCFFFNKTSWKAFWHLCTVYLVSSFTGDCIRSNYLCPQTNAVYLIKGKKNKVITQSRSRTNSANRLWRFRGYALLT